MKKHTTKLVGCALATAAVFVSGVQAGEPVVMPEPVEPHCAWSVGLEALYLKAHSNEGEYDDQDYEFAYRLEASYQPAGGMGFRLRYFDFDGTDDNGQHYPEMEAFDLELFDNFELGNWNGEFSAGVRYGTFWEGTSGHTDVDFEGWGPTLGLELTRKLSGNLSLYAGIRGSWLFGDDDENYDDSSTFIAEGALGLQYDFRSFGACSSYVRLGMEAQNWMSISDDDNEDTSLFGGSLKVVFNF